MLTGAKIAYDHMRAAGLKNVDALTQQGLLQPELGRILLQKAASVKPGTKLFKEFLQRMAMIATTSAVQAPRARQTAH